MADSDEKGLIQLKISPHDKGGLLLEYTDSNVKPRILYRKHHKLLTKERGETCELITGNGGLRIFGFGDASFALQDGVYTVKVNSSGNARFLESLLCFPGIEMKLLGEQWAVIFKDRFDRHSWFRHFRKAGPAKRSRSTAAKKSPTSMWSKVKQYLD